MCVRVCVGVLIASGVENVKRIGETKVNFMSGVVDRETVSFRFPVELSRNVGYLRAIAGNTRLITKGAE